MKKSNILTALVCTLIFGAGCRDRNTCSTNAKIIYNYSFTDCQFYIEINNIIYEPINLDEWDNQLVYADTQYVKIDYQFLNEFSACGAVDKIQLFCVSDR